MRQRPPRSPLVPGGRCRARTTRTALLLPARPVHGGVDTAGHHRRIELSSGAMSTSDLGPRSSGGVAGPFTSPAARLRGAMEEG